MHVPAHNPAAAPATVSGELATEMPLGAERQLGRAVESDDPQARRPATSSGHARTHWAGCPDVETDPGPVAASGVAWASYRFAVTGDVCRGSVLSVPLSDPAQRDIDPLELYASAIDTSDYVAALAPVDPAGGARGRTSARCRRRRRPARHGDPRSGAIVDRDRTLADHAGAPCAKLAHPPRVIAAGWRTGRGHAWSRHRPGRDHAGLLRSSRSFLARCRAWARTVVWVVPAHAGPQGAVLRRLPAARMASRGRDARHRHHHARPGALVVSTARRLHRLDLHRRRARSSGAFCFPRRSPGLEPVGRPSRANDSASRPAGEAHGSRAIASTSREDLPFLCGDNNEQTYRAGNRQPDPAIRPSLARGSDGAGPIATAVAS